ncbi:hypothetical protein HBE96_17760 [Clostridium sp. P21]|uniref:Uncharacterized protein n=1 Tax=Clostridium muellerianum TaxID=2716538 RepID=A0A7Y0EJ68_9CLOT|nr:hypothetical protein [Clostridium muellerianum]NMM64466.1 hypothetical protein [Clostridium muellerianum]
MWLVENQILVVTNIDLESEKIYYNGDNEVQAYKRHKEVQHPNKQIVRANVKMCKIREYDFIHSFEVIERLV